MNEAGALSLSRYCKRYPVDLDQTVSGDAFIDALQRYRVPNRQSVFDLAMIVTSAEIFRGQHISELDPMLVEAIRSTNPTLALNNFQDLSDAQLLGAVNTAKGKYFEYLVVERLNAGEQVGALVLPEGYKAVLADKQNQPGWDIQIVGDDPMAVEYLQLKATDSIAYIKTALDRYPDIQILATNEVAGSGLVIDSGMSEDSLREQVVSAIDVMNDSIVEQFLDYFNPLVPLAMVVVSEGYKLVIGKSEVETFKERLATRSGRVFVAGVAGGVAYAMGGPVFCIPATIVGGLMYDRYVNQSDMEKAFARSKDRLMTMRIVQQNRLIAGAIS